jgi:hypothetical protein
MIFLIQAILIIVGLILIFRKTKFRIKISKDASSIIGFIGIFFTILLLPPIFGRIFAVAPLLKGEIWGLWFFCLTLIIISLLLIFARGKRKNEISLIFFSFLFIVGIELGARFVVNVFFHRFKSRLAELANRTYPECTLYTGHPFLQYIHNPDFVLENDTTKGPFKPFNSLGFKGHDYPYEKPKNTVRIACIGGSTTAHGYPRLLENYLNGLPQVKNDSVRFQGMNFGVAGYSSAHSLVNFLLNVVDFDPDYVVIQHAWNDEMVRNYATGFKSDYSHAFKFYHEPVVVDRFPIRISIIYRYFKAALTGEPGWAYLQTATVHRTSDELLAAAQKIEWKNLEELKPFRRNIETIIDLALLRNIKPVLVTMPHTINPKLFWYYVYPHVDQCNDILREIHTKYRDKIIFIDLDQMITGKRDDFFNDLAHMNDEGEELKAEQIGNAILQDYSKNINKR